jgi:hypothetical protein
VWKGKQTVMYLSRARETTVYTLPKNIPSSNHHHFSRRGRDQTGKMENVDSDQFSKDASQTFKVSCFYSKLFYLTFFFSYCRDVTIISIIIKQSLLVLPPAANRGESQSSQHVTYKSNYTTYNV